MQLWLIKLLLMVTLTKSMTFLTVICDLNCLVLNMETFFSILSYYSNKNTVKTRTLPTETQISALKKPCLWSINKIYSPARISTGIKCCRQHFMTMSVSFFSAVRRSSHSLATDMFEQHLGAHLLQVTTASPTHCFLYRTDYVYSWLFLPCLCCVVKQRN